PGPAGDHGRRPAPHAMDTSTSTNNSSSRPVTPAGGQANADLEGVSGYGTTGLRPDDEARRVGTGCWLLRRTAAHPPGARRGTAAGVSRTSRQSGCRVDVVTHLVTIAATSPNVEHHTGKNQDDDRYKDPKDPKALDHLCASNPTRSAAG